MHSQSSGDGGGTDRLYAQILHVSGNPYPSPAVLQDLVDVLLPELETLDGFGGCQVLVDRDDNDLVITMFWESLEQLERAGQRAANAAAGLIVIAEGGHSRTGICDVVVSGPVRRVRTTDLRPPGMER